MLSRLSALCRPNGGSLALGRRALSSGSNATLSVLIERLPVVTPELADWEVEQRLAAEAYANSRSKVYQEEYTAAEEGPERTRARLRLEQVVESMGGREGEGDRSGDESSMDRKLAERVYLLLQGEDGSWSLPQRPWAPPERARDGLRELIAASCGEDLQVHQVGNAPLAHLQREQDTIFVWRFQHVEGEVAAPDPEGGATHTHAWLTKDELAERIGGPLGAIAREACGTLL